MDPIWKTDVCIVTGSSLSGTNYEIISTIWKYGLQACFIISNYKNQNLNVSIP